MAHVGIGPLFVVDGPRPQKPRYSLVNAAQIVDEPGDHWMNGVAVHGYPADLPEGYDPCSEASGPNEKVEGEPPPNPEFGPLTVYLAETCTARGIVTNDDFRARATLAFEARESWQVEHEFWTGDILPDTPHLTDSNATVLNAGAATDLINSLALLEQAIAATGQLGMIHADWATVSAWASNYHVFRDGNQIATTLGNIIVPGAGYDGSAPEGEAAPGDNQAWAFATGPVELRRSEMFLNPGELRQALDRTNNVVTYRAERYYVTDWDTHLQAAVLVDRCLPDCMTESP